MLLHVTPTKCMRLRLKFIGFRFGLEFGLTLELGFRLRLRFGLGTDFRLGVTLSMSEHEPAGIQQIIWISLGRENSKDLIDRVIYDVRALANQNKALEKRWTPQEPRYHLLFLYLENTKKLNELKRLY